MDNTITFTTENGRFTVSILVTFIERNQRFNPDLLTENMYDLVNRYNIQKYLHNEIGPAIIDHKNNVVQFWIKGKQLDKETAEKMQYRISFDNKFDDFLK